LTKNLGGYPKQSAVNALLTDAEGQTYDFHVSNHSGVSSSIFDFQDRNKLWPDIVFTGTIQLRSTTLTAVLEKLGPSASKFDALVLDVQGAELLVLKGAGAFLDKVRYVKLEASDFEAYRGACTLEAVSAALAERGFLVRRKDRFAEKEGVGAYYDVLYERHA